MAEKFPGPSLPAPHGASSALHMALCIEGVQGLPAKSPEGGKVILGLLERKANDHISHPSNLGPK